MVWRPDDFQRELRQAVDTFDRDRASELVTTLVEHLGQRPDPYPLAAARTVLTLLRRKRHFDLMQRAADAFIQGGQGGYRIRREYAQSLLDQGNLTAGLHVLRPLATDTEPDPADDRDEADSKQAEHAEAWGLIGRAFKQRYANARAPAIPRNQNYLREAIRAYHRVYVTDPKAFTWQGINSVALIRRAEADGVDVGEIGGFADPRGLADSMATRILERMGGLLDDQKAEYWNFATAVEACVGLGRHDEALEWLERYLDDRNTDAFEIASTYRQLTEVWGLTAEAPPGDRILPALRSTLLKKQGGELELAVGEAGADRLAALGQDESYEKVLGADTFRTVKWFDRCLDRARAVARIEDPSGNPMGTGFLVRGEDFHPSLAGRSLLLTNNHVVSTLAEEAWALPPDKAVATFELTSGASREYRLGPGVVWESARNDLDATLVLLDAAVEGADPVPLTRVLPARDSNERAYVIGHPRGRRLSFSIHDNHILDHDRRLVHYRSPTEPGSSGSPVFNEDWELIALHHAGSRSMRRLNGEPGTYPANEGVAAGAIVERVAAALGG